MARKSGTLKLVHTSDTVEVIATGGFIAPDHLKDFLQPTQIREITFRSENSMEAYRRMVYSINKQGEFRFRTMRSDASHWALAIWRMR